MKPRIFISTVSSELKSIRQLTANVLQGLGYEPVWQDIFGAEPGDLRQMLRDKIDDCMGLIQIVGRGYGAEPAEPDPEFGRVSYTQYELLYARQRKKTTWLLFAEDGCTHDKPLDQLDLPHDSNHPDPLAYQAERRALQDAWRERLRHDGHLRHAASNDTELELKLERLKSEFADLKRGFRRWQALVLGVGVASVLLIAGLFLMQRWAKRTSDEGMKRISAQVAEVKSGQTLSGTRIRHRLLEVSERARDEDLKKAEQEPEFDERERLREQARKAHEIRLGRIDELTASFVALEQLEETSPVLREMIRILTEEKTNPVDKAIAFAEKQRPALLQRVQARKLAEQERTRSELQPLLKAALLEAARGRPDAARTRFQELLELEPSWPQALEIYAYFLSDQSFETLADGSLQAALADAEHGLELATRLHTQDRTRPESQRVLSVVGDQLGDVLVVRGQPGDAEQALKNYTRGLEMSEELLKRNPNFAEAARDVSISQIKLGELDFKLQRFEPAITRYNAGIAVLDGMIARGVNVEQSGREKAFLESRLRECLVALATGDRDTLLKTAPGLLPTLLYYRVTLLSQQQGRLADVAEAGETLRQLEPKAPENLYNAACAYALSAAIVVKGQPAPARAEDAERRKYIELALACLKEAVAAGFKDFDHMRQDEDLKPLHGRPEFEDLVARAGRK